MFNNFLNSFNQRPFEQHKTQHEKYMVLHLLGKHDKSREHHHSLATYLKDYYSGIQDEDYQLAFKNIQTFKERIQNIQTKSDLMSLVPKFQHLENLRQQQLKKEEEEKRKEEEARIQALQGLEQGFCFLCEKQYSIAFYDVFEKRRQYTLCHECCQQCRPNVIARKNLEDQLLHKRGKIPVHLKELKEKLKQKRALKLQQLEKPLNEEELDIISDSDPEEKHCISQNCPLESNKEVIKCKSCERAWHSQCLDPPLNYKLVGRFDYFCTECKLCVLCWRSINEDKLLMCDCCDRAFHMECIQPPIIEVPEGKWFCQDCVKCASCKNVLLTNQNFNTKIQEKYADQTVDSKIICDRCWEFYKKKEYCPVCYKVIDEGQGQNYVCCDNCNLWIHFTCEKLSEKQIKEVQQIKNYTCKNCKKIQEKETAIKTLNEKLENSPTGNLTLFYPTNQQDQTQTQQQQQLQQKQQQNLKNSTNSKRNRDNSLEEEEEEEEEQSSVAVQKKVKVQKNQPKNKKYYSDDEEESDDDRDKDEDFKI
ncbi:Zinc finger, FYVE/PHD-type [Pseudocohnilembus persalinus]|uniref:Zinc finger, FYVE/PHD-type n=1 Tax=Pseudocohnilembus persalinus TaxID=266149 RepID=A0A0V0R6P3_PSEPJ|nr:Zinc finger, FYVE/PHD-type [Pseudocohnilembus persalinus]|eukprot:KRX09893.1 Zinc finger, FYVE/PHD-type [Pseudocohnilembus persalinus]